MRDGTLIAVVGPSGVGKDSVMAGLANEWPGLHLVRRTITRAPGLGGEDYDPVTVPAFHDMVQEGAFVLHWGAHGLFYGIPEQVRARLAAGTDCLVNFSRKALAEGAQVFPRFLVLNISATPETLAARLASRGRETEDEIARRLAEGQKPLPPGLTVVNVQNDGLLVETVAQARDRLQAAMTETVTP